jgi:hypothetical protein
MMKQLMALTSQDLPLVAMFIFNFGSSCVCIASFICSTSFLMHKLVLVWEDRIGLVSHNSSPLIVLKYNKNLYSF